MMPESASLDSLKRKQSAADDGATCAKGARTGTDAEYRALAEEDDETYQTWKMVPSIR